MNTSDTVRKKKKKAKYSLEDLDVFEVSLVSKPAIGVKYIMTKSDDTGLLEDENTDAGTSPADTGVNGMNEKLQALLKSAELELDETIAGALDVIFTSEFKEAVPEGLMQGIYKEAGYEIPKEEVQVEVEKVVEKIVEVPVEKSEESGDEDKEEVLKGLSSDQLALFKEQEEKIKLSGEVAEKALKTAEKERSERLNREYIQKASEEYNELPFDAKDLGPVLKSIEENLDEETRKIVLGIFSTAKEALESSKQMEEIGQAGGTNDKSNDWLEEAKALVEKGKFETRGAAVEHLMLNQPKLFLGGN